MNVETDFNLRDRPEPNLDAESMPSWGANEVVITRWRSAEGAAIGPVVNHHFALLMIAVVATEGTSRIEGAVAHDGRFAAGMFQLVPPGAMAHWCFRAAADFVRVHIPRQIYGDLTRDTAFARLAPQLKARPVQDDVVRRLAWNIVQASGGGAADEQVLDSIGTALIARAAAIVTAPDCRCGAEDLAAWRLKLVVELIEENLDKPVSLADLAGAAGLSRMHFAAQFKLATGFRPREYLTRRRIERAQMLLQDTDMSLVQIALDVGFQSQAHFTTIFERYAGAPPGRWRQNKATCTRPVDRDDGARRERGTFSLWSRATASSVLRPRDAHAS